MQTSLSGPAGRIHFIGIDGISMSALAAIMLSRGWEVSGSDLKQSQLTNKLIAQGASFMLGQSADHVKDADIVVYTAAVKPDNPELCAAQSRGLSVYNRAQFLGALMSEARCGIAVSGAHGKTTTTALVGLMLERAGLNPTVLVGGELDALGGNLRIGGSDYFVAEACEYYESFLELRPRLGIILNVDADHLDYFGSLSGIMDSFRRFAALIPPDGELIACRDDEHVRTLLGDLECRVTTYGLSEEAEWQARDITAENGGSTFSVYHRSQRMGNVRLTVPGRHNVLNCLAALATGHSLGIDWGSMVATVALFVGTHRRFEHKGYFGGARIIDDYAHHPTEIRATLAAAREQRPQRLIVVFQSHTYTRTSALLEDFATAFADADMVVVTDIYAAREVNTSGITGKSLADSISLHHPSVVYRARLSEATQYLRQELQPGDMVITMGAGDIHLVGEDLLR